MLQKVLKVSLQNCECCGSTAGVTKTLLTDRCASSLDREFTGVLSTANCREVSTNNFDDLGVIKCNISAAEGSEGQAAELRKLRVNGGSNHDPLNRPFRLVARS